VGFLGKLHLGNCFQKLSDGFFEKFMPRNLESFFDGGGMGAFLTVSHFFISFQSSG
jgi:hypothetical protein